MFDRADETAKLHRRDVRLETVCVSGVVPEVSEVRSPYHKIAMGLNVETVGQVEGMAPVLVDTLDGCG